MNDQLTLTLPSALFRDLAFFSTNPNEFDEETMNELKQKLDQLLAGQAELKALRATEPALPAEQNGDLAQTINRLFTMIKRDYSNRQAINSLSQSGSTRNFPPYSGETWRAKLTVKRSENLPLDQTGFNLKVPLPERFVGKRGVFRYLEDQPEIDLTRYWNSWDYIDNPVTLPLSIWVQGFAENETEKNIYVIFNAYPDIENLDELEWENIEAEMPVE